MIKIDRLQEYYIQNRIIISVHAQERLRQRGLLPLTVYPNIRQLGKGKSFSLSENIQDIAT